jgi:hypothetical protein
MPLPNPGRFKPKATPKTSDFKEPIAALKAGVAAKHVREHFKLRDVELGIARFDAGLVK